MRKSFHKSFHKSSSLHAGGKKRQHLSKHSSKKIFRKGAMHVNHRNITAMPMRGGYRM